VASGRGSPRVVPADTEIIRDGVQMQSLFVVADGELSVRKGDHEIAQLGAGEIVGEMSLLDSRPPSATVVASQTSTLFVVSHASLRSKLATDPQFGARFYRALCVFLANRLSRTDAMIGAGGRVPDEEETARADEISPEALENVVLAGARFDWFLQRVRSA